MRRLIRIAMFAVTITATCVAPFETLSKSEGVDVSIVTRFNSQPPSFKVRPIKLSKRGKTVIDLEMGEDIDSSEVTLAADKSGRYRMLQRYRTSMSVMAEGPHLDLLDWRHFDSTWTVLPELDVHRFRTLRSDEMDASKFPPTSKAEIIREVRKQVGTNSSDLLERAKTCRRPNDGWCAVMISSMYLRIQKLVNGHWIDVGLMEFRFPLGC